MAVRPKPWRARLGSRASLLALAFWPRAGVCSWDAPSPADEPWTSCRQPGNGTGATPLGELCWLLRRQDESFDIMFDSYKHNHLAYVLIATYRLGGSVARLDDLYRWGSHQLDRKLPSKHRASASSWMRLRGAGSGYYSDFEEFFHAEVARLGPAGALSEYLPGLVEGLNGGLLHPLIQLGYAFESHNTDVLTEALTEFAIFYDKLPGMSEEPRQTDLVQTFARVRADGRFPRWAANQSRTERIEVLLQPEHRSALAEYDVALGSTSLDEWARRVSLGVLMLFCAKNYDDFFFLHLVTGARALQMILQQGLPLWVQQQAVRYFWKVIVITYIVHGRVPVIYPPVGELRDWDSIVASALQRGNEWHLTKMVFLARENQARWGEPLYQQMAARVVDIFGPGGAGEWDYRPMPEEQVVEYI